MSLLKKASIITTPTAYAEDYLYSIKPAKVTVNSITSFANGTTYPLTTFTSSVNNITSGIVSSAFGGCVSNAITLKKNQKVKVTFDYTQNSGNELRVVFSSSTNGAGTQISDPTTINATGTFNHTFTITSDSTGYLQLGTGNSGHSINFSALNVRAEVLSLADFDFDRNSTGTRVNEDYLIEDVPYNLNTYSEDFDQWTKINVTVSSDQILAPDGTLSADKLIATSGASNKVIFQGITAGTYTASVFAKKGEFEGLFIGTGTVGAFFNLNTYAYRTHYTSPPTSYQIESYGNGWYRYSITFTESSNNNLYIGPNDNVSTTLAITGDGSKGIYIWGAQLVKGDQPKDYLKTTDRLDIPRIDYTNGEPSILLEPSRQNLVTHSEALTTYWTLQGASLIADNTAVNPTGNTFANKLNSTNTSTFRSITRNESTAWDSKTLTMSCFAKKITNDYIFFYNIGSVSGINGLWFNISNGTIGTNGAAWSNAKIENYGNGWYRCSAKITFGTSDNYLYINNSDGDNNTSSTVGSQTYIWGTQIEEGSYATSYIPTSGSAVTRSADYVSNAGNSDLISSTEGVLYGELSKPQLDNDAHLLIALINNGATTDQNTVTIGFDSDDDFFIRIKSSGSDILKYNSATSYPNQFYKIAVKYKSGDSSMYIDGKQVASSTNTFTFVNTLNEINFNFDNNNGLPFYGNCKSIMVFKEALSDTELECLTGYNNHELYMNYYNRLSYLGLVEEYNVESDINNYIL